MNKPPGSDGKLSKDSKVYIQKLEALKELARRSEQINAIRIKATAAQGDCMLALATQLLTLKFDLQVSWEELAKHLSQVADHTTLYKIAYRQIWIKRDTYKLISLSVNAVRQKIGLREHKFPDWIDWRSLNQ